MIRNKLFEEFSLLFQFIKFRSYNVLECKSIHATPSAKNNIFYKSLNWLSSRDENAVKWIDTIKLHIFHCIFMIHAAHLRPNLF